MYNYETSATQRENENSRVEFNGNYITHIPLGTGIYFMAMGVEIMCGLVVERISIFSAQIHKEKILDMFYETAK